MSFKETMTHGNTNCHKNAQERIWDSSRTMALSLPLCSATHPFPRADEGTDNATRWIDNCIEVLWIISILSSPFLNNLPSLSIKFQLFLLLLPLLWAAASVNFYLWISALLPPGCCGGTKHCGVPMSPAWGAGACLQSGNACPPRDKTTTRQLLCSSVHENGLQKALFSSIFPP